MSIPDIDDRTWKNIEDTVRWVKNNGPRLLAFLQGESQVPKQELAIRGILTQAVHSNGTGLLKIVERVSIANSFLLSVIGINPPEEATFKLKLVGTTTTGSEDVLTTANLDLSEDLTADNLRAAIVRASNSGPFPLTDEMVSVSLGNPFTDARLVGLFAVPPADLPVSYVGRWSITFSPEVTANYSEGLELSTQDVTIQGLSAVVVHATKDAVTEETEIVTDVYNRPADNPWLAGCTVVCVPMIDVGFAIVGSDHRDTEQAP